MPRLRKASGPLGRRPATVDLRSERSGQAGPYALRVTSGLRLRVGRVQPGRLVPRRDFDGDADLGDDGGPTRRAATLGLGYVVRGVSGSLTTEYRGGVAPGCEALDACGLAGSRTLRFDVDGSEVVGIEELDLFAGRPLRSGRLSTARLLRDLRAGRLTGGASLAVDAAVPGTARTERPGAPPCEDAGPTELPPIDTKLEREGLRVELGPRQFIFDEDPLRSRCAGPGFADVVGREPLAVATVPAASLGDRTLRLTLRAEGAFPPGPYAGERRGALVIDLERVRLRTGIARLPVNRH